MLKNRLEINKFSSAAIEGNYKIIDRSQLIQENRQLQKQLRALLDNVRQNEEKLKRLQKLELRLMACSELFELLHTVIYEYRVTSGLEHVSLILHDPEYELRRIYMDERSPTNEHPDIIFVNDISDIKVFYGSALNPHLGTYQQNYHQQFFARKLHSVSSVALLPLVRKMKLIGSLNLASYRQNRFSENNASDFLQRLATIITACLENVCNQEKLKKLGITDMLTGVNNRRFFDQRLQEEVARAQRDNLIISCLFFDVDFFKKVNDTHGHSNGDLVLREIAALIRINLRNSDVLARYGGEEFSAILNNSDTEKAIEIAERIRQSVEQRAFETSDGESLQITISIGVATLHAGGYPIDSNNLGQKLIQNADQCLYDAKQSGRNRIISITDEQFLQTEKLK